MPKQIIRHRGLVAGSLLLSLLAACVSMPTAPASHLALPASAAPMDGYDWHFDSNAEEVQLAYGIANSDEIPFGFSCRRGSGRIVMNATTLNSALKTITLATSETSQTYRARQEEAVMFDGYLLEAETAADDALLASFDKTGWLSIENDGAWVGLAPQSGTKVQSADFIAACR